MKVRGMFLAAWLLAAGPALAEPAFQRLLPLLVDLPGFTAGKADGMTLDTGQGAMTTANRHYRKDDKSLEANVIVGQAAEGVLAQVGTGIKVETSEGHMLPGEADGFQLLKIFSAQEASGSLLVALGKQAALSVSYKGLSEADALALARKLDWKALAAAAK